MGRCLRWLDRFADKMRARGLGSLFHYKTEKFIKVDVPQVEVLFRVSQALCLFVEALDGSQDDARSGVAGRDYHLQEDAAAP